MLLNAGKIFDGNHTALSNAAGTPKSAESFRRVYIDPIFAADYHKGAEIEAAYGEVISDYQRDGFIIGFNTAVQLLTSCMSDGINSEQKS